MTHIADEIINRRNNQLHDRAHEVLEYRKHTGELFWRVPKAPYMKAGDRAGHKHHSGYNTIMLDGVTYRSRHLIWLMMSGRLPHRVFSVNRIRDDDRLENLFT